MVFNYVRLYSLGCKTTRHLCLLVGAVITTGISLPLSSAHAQDITTGLIGHWELDETSGASIADSSASGLTGTWVDGTGNDVAEETGAGQIDTALTFDGTDDYISIPDASNTMDIAYPITISTWVYPTDFSSLMSIFASDVDGTNYNGYFLVIEQTTGNASIHYGDGGNVGPTSRRSGFGSTALNLNQWNHVVSIIRGPTDMSIYVNDTADTITYTGTGSAVAFSSSGGNISHYYNGSWFNSNATIDDVRMYNRALTVPDVAALYAAGSSICSAPTGHAGEIIYNDDDNVLQYCNGSSWVAIGPTSDLSGSLIGHWKLDETSGSAIADSSGNGLNGTWSDSSGNDVTEETGAGPIGDALTFDGTDDYISILDAGNAMDVAYPITISTWVYPTSFLASSTIFSTDVASSNYHGYFLNINSSGIVNMQYGDGTAANSTARRSGSASTALNLNQWNHITGIIRGPTDMSIYINGVADTVTYSGTGGAVAFSSTTGYIGRWYHGASGFLDHTIDDVRFYSRALSPFEVQSLHDIGPSCMEPPSTSPVGHWTMDETTGNTIADSSGNSMDGTWDDSDDNDVTGETSTGMQANSIHFDGADDYIEIPYNSLLELTNDAGTVMAWIKSDTANIGQNTVWPIFRKFEHSNQDDIGAYQLELYQGGPTAPINLGGRFNATSFLGTTTILANQWYHVVMSWDTDNAYLYLDGALERGGIKPSSFTYAMNSPARIGIGLSGGGYGNAVGDIDDIRVYNETLSPVEISAIYGATGGTCTLALCSSPFGVKGEIVYNADFDVMQYCNGGSWIAMGPPGDGGANCSSPSGIAGTLRYDGDNDVLMYCEGDDWIAVTGYATSPIAPGPPAPCPNPGDVCLDGTVYAGITPDGSVPMYVPPSDQSAAAYWGTHSFITGSTSLTDGDGNSADVYAHVMTGDGDNNPNDGDTPNAFVLCNDLNFGGHNDWYLPARDELNVLYTNEAAIGGFNTSVYYWSSSENNMGTARRQIFNSGSQATNWKYTAYAIRCARHD